MRAIAEFLWPRGGWARAYYYVKHRLKRLPDTPERIAWDGYEPFAQPRMAQDYLTTRAAVDDPFALFVSWSVRKKIVTAPRSMPVVPA